MEAVLLSGDLGLATTEKVMGKIRQGMHEGKIKETGDVLPYMKMCIRDRGNNVLILSGLKEGEQVVTNPPEGLEIGTPVDVQ